MHEKTSTHRELAVGLAHFRPVPQGRFADPKIRNVGFCSRTNPARISTNFLRELESRGGMRSDKKNDDSAIKKANKCIQLKGQRIKNQT